MKPEQLQSKLITLLEQADERRLSCSEVKGELEDEGTALEISQIRDGFKQLEALGRVRMARVAPGSPVAWELVDVAGGVKPAAVAPQREPEEREDKDDTDDPRGRILEALAGGALKSGEIEAKAKVGSSINYYLKNLADQGKIERLNPANRQSAWILAKVSRVSRETPLPPPGGKSARAEGGGKESRKARGEGLAGEAEGQRQPARRVHRAAHQAVDHRRDRHRRRQAQGRHARPARRARAGADRARAL